MCSNKSFSFIFHGSHSTKSLDLIECALPGKRKLRERSTRLRRAITFNFSSRAIELQGGEIRLRNRAWRTRDVAVPPGQRESWTGEGEKRDCSFSRCGRGNSLPTQMRIDCGRVSSKIAGAGRKFRWRARASVVSSDVKAGKWVTYTLRSGSRVNEDGTGLGEWVSGRWLTPVTRRVFQNRRWKFGIHCTVYMTRILRYRYSQRTFLVHFVLGSLRALTFLMSNIYCVSCTQILQYNIVQIYWYIVVSYKACE